MRKSDRQGAVSRPRESYQAGPVPSHISEGHPYPQVSRARKNRGAMEKGWFLAMVLSPALVFASLMMLASAAMLASSVMLAPLRTVAELAVAFARLMMA